MFRRVFSLVAFVPLLLVSAGCGGYSEETAKTFCDQEAYAKEACMTDNAYQECMDCYMECGNDCAPQATCPATFVCATE